MRSEGAVIAWGNGEYNQTDVSVLATGIKAISAGYYHSMALRSDGGVVTWGLAYPVPAAATNIIAIKAGCQFCLALTAEGSVLAWGDNDHGHCNVPANATNVVASASAYYCSAALRRDGSIVSWGSDRIETTGAPSPENQASRYLQVNGTVMESVSRILTTNGIYLASGAGHSLALRADGTIAAAGLNHSGKTTISAIPGGVASVAAGGDHSLAVLLDGRMECWGDNDFGQTTPPPFLSNVVAAAAGGAHSLALLGDGSPRFALAPVAHDGRIGQDHRLTALAVGKPPMTYQWQLNGRDLQGATNSSLALPQLQLQQWGPYRVIASNVLGRAVSREVLISLPGVEPILLQGTSGASLGMAGFQLKFRDWVGVRPVVLYASSNLAYWQPIFTNMPSLDWVLHLDTTSPAATARYYRAAYGP